MAEDHRQSVQTSTSARLTLPPVTTLTVTLIAIVGVGAIAGHGHSADWVIGWMHVHAVTDFPNLPSLLSFLINTRLPIPPALAIVEWLAVQSFHDPKPILAAIYQAMLTGSFALAALISYPSRVRIGLVGVLSLVLLPPAFEIHAANPAVYDVVLPFFLLAFALAIKIAAQTVRPITASTTIVIAAAALALADQMRPFGVLLLPIALVSAAVLLIVCRRKRLAALLTIVTLAFTLPYHTNHWLRFGQPTSSNHAGFNLWRAYPVPLPPALQHDALGQDPAYRPLAEGRWANLDTDRHSENSRAYLAFILHAALQNPGAFAARGFELLTNFLTVPVVMPERPTQPGPGWASWLLLYRAVAMALTLSAAINLALYMYAPWRRARSVPVESPLVALCHALALIIIVIVAETERLEEARFWISVLPIVTLPPIWRRL